jgi:hypothetical protein
MAIPFKIEHFLFRRQGQLEKEVAENLLYRKINTLFGKESLNELLLSGMTGGCHLPDGFWSLMDEAILALKTAARLPYDIKVFLASREYAPAHAMAALEDRQLTCVLPPQLLPASSLAELVYHLATSTFFAIHTTPRHLAFLLSRSAPFGLQERLKAMEIVRLMSYAADCFALVCCGSMDTVLQEGFYRETGLKVQPDQADFRRMAADSLKSGQFGAAWLLNRGMWKLQYPPLKPLVLAQYLETEMYRACRGESGGVSREQFEAAVLEMERQAHPPLDELPAEQNQFTNVAALLGTHFIMEAAGAVTKGREEAFREFFDLEPTTLEALVKQIGWQRGVESNTRELLEQLLTGLHGKWANVHCLRIIEAAFVFAAKEHGGEIPDKLQSSLLDLGKWCGLEKGELVALCETILETIAEEQEKGE